MKLAFDEELSKRDSVSVHIVRLQCSFLIVYCATVAQHVRVLVGKSGLKVQTNRHAAVIVSLCMCACTFCVYTHA